MEKADTRTLIDVLKNDETKALEKLSNSLPQSYKNFFDFAYIINDTLYFQFHNPGIIQEFRMNKGKIRNALIEVYRKESLKDIISFSNFEARFKEKTKIDKTKEQREICKRGSSFDEQSNGEFEIQSEDREIKRAFEKIKKAIKEKL